jgi:polar amino acid transport system ATP-binding protein
MVEARQVRKHFGRLAVLRGIDLTVNRGEVMCLIGPSGAGKSTFIRCINHLEKIDGGELSVDGELVGYRQSGNRLYELRDREVCGMRSHIGMVFQRFNLFPHMSAIDNVMSAPVWVKKEPVAAARERAHRLLERVGLADKMESYPNQLSGGQQQRVAIARAMCTNPSLILADEPTGNLDSRSSAELMSLFTGLHDQGRTIVMITHEPDIAAYASRVVVLRDGEIVSDRPQDTSSAVSYELAPSGRYSCGESGVES